MVSHNSPGLTAGGAEGIILRPGPVPRRRPLRQYFSSEHRRRGLPGGDVADFAFPGGVPLNVFPRNISPAMATVPGYGRRKWIEAFTELQSR